jgi:hypothetical protein
MEGVQFEEDTYKGFQQANYQTEQDSKMITLLIKSGLVKDKKQANILLLSCVTIFLLTSVYVFSTSADPELEVIPYDQMTAEQKQLVPPQERAFLESQMNNTQ